MYVQTNQPYTNRIQLVLTPFFGPFVQPGPLGDFDPRRDLEVYVDGTRQVVQTFSYDPINNRYLLFMQNSINLQGVVQLVYHTVSPPFQGRVQAEVDATASSGTGTQELWVASTNYSLGQTIIDINGNLQTVVGVIGGDDTGTSGGLQPTWPLVTGGTVSDNNLIWATGSLGQQAVSGFGAFDKSAQNGDTISNPTLQTSSLAPVNSSTLALLCASAVGPVLASGWHDMGAPAGISGRLLQVASFPTPSPISVTESTSTRWASNLLLFGGSGLSLTASVTNVQVAANILTLAIVAPQYIVGTRLSFTGFVGASFLNNNFATIISNSGTHITLGFTHANYGPTADSGTATYCPFTQAVNINGSLTTAGTYMATFPNPVQAGSTILVLSITADNNAEAVITAVSDTQSGSYDILFAFSPGGVPANRPGCSVAFAQNVHGGATTVSTTVSPVAAAPGSISFFMLELPVGASVPFPEVPWTPGVAPSGSVVVNGGTGSFSQTLTVSGFDFGTPIPSNATVTGLELVITGSQSAAEFSTYLTVSPTNPILDSPPVFTVQLPVTSGEVVFGSPTTTFGYTLTPAFVNDPSNFFFNLQAADTNGNNVTFNFESATLKVYYYTLQDIVLGATVGGFAQIGSFSTEGDGTLFPPNATLVPSSTSSPTSTTLTLTYTTSAVSFVRITAANSFDTGLVAVSGGQGTSVIDGSNPLLGTAGSITFQMTCYDGNENPINVNGENSPNVMVAVYLT